MAAISPESLEQQTPNTKIQIYSTPNSGVSTFWKDKYERDAKKYWDIFYKRHQDKFFKDRHYLDKEWGSHFAGAGGKVYLEVGCGAGNTIFPLRATYPEVFVHACDFSQRAISLVKSHKEYSETFINAFVCDLTSDDLSKHILPSSVDIVTMIFVLSAVSPEKMASVMQNIRTVLKPNGLVLFRDYATGDLAQERFICKDQKISENFYVRGDGTRAFYFSEEYLGHLFKENGFHTKEIELCCKQVENRSRELVMNRRWIQGVFSIKDDNIELDVKPVLYKDSLHTENIDNGVMEKVTGETHTMDVDISEGVGLDMFGVSPSEDEVDLSFGNFNFKIKIVSKEYQHTCKSTGLMLWESARLMAAILAENPSITARKRVLELGCGCSGICSMVAAQYADLVVATDGDAKALDLLSENVAANLATPNKLQVKTLRWGNDEHIEAIKKVNMGFDVMLGTDVTYIPEAIYPLFATAGKLILSDPINEKESEPALILCHILRRVDEPSILSAASQFGFKLVDRWPSETPSHTNSIMNSWLLKMDLKDKIPSSGLSILYFQRA